MQKLYCRIVENNKVKMYNYYFYINEREVSKMEKKRD